MKLLLDTCTFLWMANTPEKLSPLARQALSGNEHEVFLSAVSGWEVLLKQQHANYLSLDMPAAQFVQQGLHLMDLEELPLNLGCLEYLEKLPVYHRDPFDRILICQALDAACTLVTPDTNIHRYPVPILW
ncbi:MAG: type II toxin-antitoxin system VapC family toxin [Terrimicrobiaceae bacterium]